MLSLLKESLTLISSNTGASGTPGHYLVTVNYIEISSAAFRAIAVPVKMYVQKIMCFVCRIRSVWLLVLASLVFLAPSVIFIDGYSCPF